ncbi:hypothetical protein [Granulicatella adiacens]|uniref:hypothetical protein n=1 Tax=Granulicatella adiacens TaxID=46124 RepID=UPI001C3CA3DF|nr:hypothetical protein [Granulicatella adiacens]
MVDVEYFFDDGQGKKRSDIENISNLAVAKHFIVAGSGNVLDVKDILKSIGALLYYSDYFPSDKKAKHFNKVTGYRYDPSLQAHFTYLIGKSFADYFFKLFYPGGITTNYEALATLKKGKIPKGKRPDLIGIQNKIKYSIEAKGRDQLSRQEFGKLYNNAKNQASNDKLGCKYFIASITKDIYSDINIHFIDPEGDDYIDKSPSAEDVISLYYKNLLYELKERENKSIIKRNGENFIVIAAFNFKGENLSLAILESIVKNNLNIFETRRERIAREDYYIDSDGIGVFKVDANDFNTEELKKEKSVQQFEYIMY